MAGTCKMTAKYGIILFFYVFSTALHASADHTESHGKLQLVTKEQSLGKVHPGIMHETIVLSPNNRRIAYGAFKLNGKGVVVLDGMESEEYDDADNFVFSSDSERFAYAAAESAVAGFMEGALF